MSSVHVAFNQRSEAERTIASLGQTIYKLAEQRKRYAGMQSDLENELMAIMEGTGIAQMEAGTLQIALTTADKLRGVNRDRFDEVLATITDPELLAKLNECYYELAVAPSVVIYDPIHVRNQIKEELKNYGS